MLGSANASMSEMEARPLPGKIALSIEPRGFRRSNAARVVFFVRAGASEYEAANGAPLSVLAVSEPMLAPAVYGRGAVDVADSRESMSSWNCWAS